MMLQCSYSMVCTSRTNGQWKDIVNWNWSKFQDKTWSFYNDHCSLLEKREWLRKIYICDSIKYKIGYNSGICLLKSVNMLNRRLGGPQSRSGLRIENSWPYQDLNSDPLVIQPVASRYTNYYILAPWEVCSSKWKWINPIHHSHVTHFFMLWNLIFCPVWNACTAHL
jgi:hypothetical protein